MNYREQSPIENVEWVDVDSLQANDYNPNLVMSTEMKLLEYSIMTNGWIQPILVDQNGVIIDGFHRGTIAKKSKTLRQRYEGKVPVVRMDLSERERMLLTIRINRAKGSHLAFKMSDIIRKLVNDYGMTVKEVCKGIGAKKDEVDRLLQEDVFKALDTANHVYSKAWYPKK